MKTYPLHLGPLLVCLLLGSVVLPGQADSVEFHVSPTGNDANPGTANKPFATPERARDEWRHRRGENPSGATIWVHGGTYFRTNSLELGKLDSGTPNSPVTWQAAGGETPRFLGARRVTGFQPVTDRAVLSRFAKEAKSHVLQVKLSDLGITDFGEFKSRGYERPPAVAHGELFYRGKPMTLARWPNVGEFAAISGSPSPSARPDSEPMGSLEGGFNYEGDRPGRWKPADDIWVQGYWAQDWANSSERVQSLDPGSHLVKTAAPHGIFGFKKGQRFYFFNVLEELDRPGEWYIDRAGGILYFWPPDSTGPDRSPEILFSTLAETFVKLNEASHITLRGLTFDTARAHGISIVNGNGVRVTKCVIRNVGDTGVVAVGGTDNGVSDCDIFNCGDGGVSISGGDRKTLTPGRSFVENCHVANAGRWSKCFLPAIDLVGVGLRASHNLVHDHPHRGIQFAGNDMLVDYNEVHDVALETADVGAIYTGRDYSFRGNRVSYNFLHHISGTNYGSMGIYMDDLVSGTQISGNVFYKVKRAVFLGGGRDHHVVNNVFVDCDPAIQADGRGLDPKPQWHNMVAKTMRERVNSVPSELYRERYPALKSLDKYYGGPGENNKLAAEPAGIPPEDNVIARNICVGNWLVVGWNAKEEWFHIENNYTNGAPKFVGSSDKKVRVTRFALQPDSPAWALGFERIPVENIGLQRPE